MTKSTDRRARRAGLTLKKCRRGVVYVDPFTGQSVYTGNRSSKNWHHERHINAFIAKKEQQSLP
jgi:hypothetical protein